MKFTVSWILNSWTNQGPGSVAVWCSVSKDGFDGWDERTGRYVNSGARVAHDTFQKFMDLLDNCKDAVKRIKEGPQDTYSRLREKVVIEGTLDSGRVIRFYQHGETSPRHMIENINNPRSSVLARMVIDYIEGEEDAPPASVIRDYILDHVKPVGEH